MEVDQEEMTQEERVGDTQSLYREFNWDRMTEHHPLHRVPHARPHM